MVYNSMKLLLIWALLFAGVTAGAQTSDRDLFNQAETRFRVGDYELALDRYETLVREHPRSRFVPDAQFRIGVTLHRLERFTEALRAFRRVELRFRSTQFLPLVPFWTGVTHFYLEDYEQAITALTVFLDNQPDHPVSSQALLYRALSLREQGLDPGPDAERIVTRAQQPGDEPFALTLLMRSLLSRERFDSVVDLFAQVQIHELDAQWAPRITVYAAEAYLALGRNEEAIALYRQLEQADVEIAGIALERLFAFAQSDENTADVDRIVLQAEQVLSTRPDLLVGFWERVGIQSFRNDRFDVAELYLNRVWEARSRHGISAAAVGHLAELRNRRSDRTRAIGMLEETVDAFEGTDRELLLLRLGVLHLGGQEYEAAARVFSRVTTEFPDGQQFVPAAYQLAFAQVQTGQADEALSTLNSLFQDGRTHGLLSELRRLQAEVATRLEDFETATTAWRDYLTVESQDALARVEFARVLFRQNRYSAVLEQTSRFFDDFVHNDGDRDDPVLQARYLAGLSSLALQNYDDTIRYLSVFAETSADRLIEPFGRFYLGWAMYRQGAWENAYAVLSGLGRDLPGHELAGRSLYIAGWSAYLDGRYNDAVDVLTLLRGVDLSARDEVEARYLLAQALRSAGNTDRALAELRTIYRDFPDSEYADDSLFEYAGILASLGRTAEAADRFGSLFERFPESPFAEDALFRRGDVFFQDGSFGAARDAWLEHRSEFPDGRLVAGSLFFGGVASYELGQTGAALLVWERLINDHRDSTFRYDAMVRASELYERRGELRLALNLLTEVVGRYPDRARAAGLQGRVDELVLRIGGIGEQEASLLVDIEQNNRARTPAGRQSILTLSRLVIYETVGESVNRRLILPLLREVVAQASASGADAAEAQFLIGEWYFQQGDLIDAAEAFVDAAAFSEASRDLAAQSLFRAAQAYRQANRPQIVREIVDSMQDGFENSDWTAEAVRLLEGL